MFYISTIREGGAARVITNLANHFSQSNQVVLVTNFAAENEYALADEVKRYSLETSEDKSNFVKKNIGRVTKLYRIMKEEKPELVVSFMHQNDGRALLAARLAGTKVLLSVRNAPDALFPTRLKKMIANVIYGLADGVVFQTRDAQAWFPQRVQKKSRVIFNPVNPAFYGIEREPQPGLIVTCGRLVQFKRHDLLISAFADVHKQEPETELHIYGEGPLREKLQAQIERMGLEACVFLKGATQSVADVLKKADLFVLSSDHEGMPNALMEAMAAGVPCVSTDCPCGGPRELLQFADDCLVPIGDQAGLRDAILSKKGVRDQRIRKCAELFSTDKVFAQWEGYIAEIKK